MSFKSDKHRRAVMAILHEMQSGRGVWYHTSVRPMRSFKQKHRYALHIGTKEAASKFLPDKLAAHTRAYRHSVQLKKGQKIKPYLYKGKYIFDEMHLNPGGADRLFGIKQGEVIGERVGMPRSWRWLTDGGKGAFYDEKAHYGGQKLRSKLRRKGYDVVPYINRHEDPGKISFVVLNPKKFKVMGRTQYRASSPYSHHTGVEELVRTPMHKYEPVPVIYSHETGTYRRGQLLSGKKQFVEHVKKNIRMHRKRRGKIPK